MNGHAPHWDNRSCSSSLAWHYLGVLQAFSTTYHFDSWMPFIYLMPYLVRHFLFVRLIFSGMLISSGKILLQNTRQYCEEAQQELLRSRGKGWKENPESDSSSGAKRESRKEKEKQQQQEQRTKDLGFYGWEYWVNEAVQIQDFNLRLPANHSHPSLNPDRSINCVHVSYAAYRYH